MTDSLRLAAVDLGAESGRVVLGRFDGDAVSLDVCHRFANRPLWLPDGLHWNLPELFAQTLDGLAAAGTGARAGPLDGIGIDAWGCDYALLDADRRMLGLPFSYRDQRTSVDNMDRAHARVDREELYARTGIQTIPINTAYQLATEAESAAARAAEHIALVPDLLGLWLTGTLGNELTIASTTGLLEARGLRWAADLVARLGLPVAPFAGEVVAPGFELGTVLEHHAGDAGAAVGAPVRAVAGHDTASAFAAAPLSGERCAVLSSGTWSLLGVELTEPQLGADAAAFNLTNERGVCGTVRLLRNVMGLWLVQECRRAWRAAGSDRDYEELQRLAAGAREDVAVFDPDDASLLHGGDMPARIAALCTGTGQVAPSGAGELVRSILVSLACKYRLVCEQLEQVTGDRVDAIHVVGGGARNTLLCQLTADVCGREVVTGPVEATALGNVLVQALALGELSGLADLRRVVARSVTPRRHEPRALSGHETYARFLEMTGLPANRAARAPV
ncbi:MAG TPA: FGGY-family carbohydrate kinase [Solirubrobacteraceae bacterium]|nr:FGGY-family carbohydrate kinase [Solirubrobacteraceae bacterium]